MALQERAEKNNHFPSNNTIFISPPPVRADVFMTMIKSDNRFDELNYNYQHNNVTSTVMPGADMIIIGGHTSPDLLDYSSNHTLCDFTHILYTTTYPISSKFLLWFCILCIIVIVVLNALVLIVLTVYWPAVRRLRNASSMRPVREAGRAQQELYIANLAFCDLFIGLILFPLWLLETVVYGCWTFPHWACRWRKILSWVLGFESGITVGLIALDRFMMVRLGPMYSQHETRTRVCLKIVVSWLVDICFFLPLSYYDTIAGVLPISINGFCFSEFYQHWQLFWTVYYFYYAVPVVFCVGTYVAIFVILKRRRHEESVKRHSAILAMQQQQQQNNTFPLLTLNNNNNPTTNGHLCNTARASASNTTTTTTLVEQNQQRYADPFKRRYRKAWITMIFLNVVFALWWLPFWLVSLVELAMKSLAEPAQQTGASFFLLDIKLGIEVIYYLNSLLNPCIYLTTIPSLRLAACKLITRLLCCQWPLRSRDRVSLMLAEDPSCASPSTVRMVGHDNYVHNNNLCEGNVTQALLASNHVASAAGSVNTTTTTRRASSASLAMKNENGNGRYLNVTSHHQCKLYDALGGSRTSTSDQSPVSMSSLGGENVSVNQHRTRQRSGSANGCLTTSAV